MFDTPDETRRGCPICRTHYTLQPNGWKPACDCEARAAARTTTQAAVDRARGPLHAALAAVATMLRPEP